MKVILLEKIHNLGDLGATVNVKAGYARNYLIPYEKAIPATKENLAKFESRRVELEKLAQEQLTLAEKRALAFKDLVLTITVRAMEEGKLFGSVGIREIIDAFKAKGITVEKKEINLPVGLIHTVGEYEIGVMLHSDIHLKVKIIVEAEK